MCGHSGTSGYSLVLVRFVPAEDSGQGPGSGAPHVADYSGDCLGKAWSGRLLWCKTDGPSMKNNGVERLKSLSGSQTGDACYNLHEIFNLQDIS